MKILSFVILVFAITGCNTSRSIYYGTTGSRYGINPYPSKEQWVNYLNEISGNNNSEPTILWIVGSYHGKGIKLNFPGSDKPGKEVYYSDIDLNEQYLEFFDKNNINVFLLVEPGFGDLKYIIKTVSDRYSHHKSVIGLGIDLEWYLADSSNPFGVVLQNSDIETIINKLEEVNPKYKLLLKHWDINKIERYNSDDVIYLQSMEGIKSVEELIDRHKIWSRFFYPSRVGIEVGFSNDMSFWSNFENPLSEIPSLIDKHSMEKSSFFWSETSLYQMLK